MLSPATPYQRGQAARRAAACLAIAERPESVPLADLCAEFCGIFNADVYKAARDLLEAHADGVAFEANCHVSAHANLGALLATWAKDCPSHELAEAIYHLRHAVLGRRETPLAIVLRGIAVGLHRAGYGQAQGAVIAAGEGAA
jgi:hypothetical protein